MAYTIDKTYTSEYEIKKSLFISTLIKVTSLKEAKEKLSEIRKKYYDATHNCYSYIIEENDSLIIKNSDDGEPSKTAGIVIYDVLKKKDLVNVLCIVTRYFGGVKLGANGLVRAYSKAASDVTMIAKIEKIEKKENLTFTINYNYVNECLNALKDFTLINKDFKEDVKMTFLVPKDKKEVLIENLIKITKNSIKIEE